MLDKLMAAQAQAQEIKNKLDNVTVQADAEGGLVTVVMTGNKTVKSVTINPSLFTDMDKEQLEDLLVVAINRAADKAEQASAAEMQSATQGLLGGLFGS